MKVHAILPVYNESKSAYDLIAAYAKLAQRSPYAIRLLVINDTSRDDSESWILKAKADFPQLDLVYEAHPENRGLTGALNTGLGLLGPMSPDDVVVTMDGDNTHNPMLIPAMVSKIEEGADIVIASRYCEQSRTAGLALGRVLLSHGARFLYGLRWRLHGVRDYTCLFRAYRQSVIARMLGRYKPANCLTEQGFACAGELLCKAASESDVIVEVPLILRYDRKVGASNMNVLKTAFNTLKMLARR
ncbi:MAG: glycosyltransferase [Rhodospirillales bacterium]|nr:glycosyltransferase [Rhodospirillales bacterium]